MRSYTTADICELMDLMRGVEDIPAAEAAGLARFRHLLLELDKMSDADFEQAARAHFHPQMGG